MRAYLPLIAEALPVAVVFLLCWRELRQLKRLRLEREARERAEAEASAARAEGESIRPGAGSVGRDAPAGEAGRADARRA